LHLTRAGAARLRAAQKLWSDAQTRFETEFGAERAFTLRNELRVVVSTELGASPEVGRSDRGSGNAARIG
jgi:hypothetical protein